MLTDGQRVTDREISDEAANLLPKESILFLHEYLNMHAAVLHI
jgi:hypothetical protein